LPLHPHIRAAVVQPLAQPRPFAQQRLVRYFDGRPARLQVAVEGEQAGFAEGLDDVPYCVLRVAYCAF